MNNMIKVADKLKNASHIKLYSPICGECKLYSIDNIECIITVIDKFGNEFFFNLYGIYITSEGIESEECLLFPSKEIREWSNFSIKKKEEYNFKPFDKVIVRDYNYQQWRADLFSNIIYDHNADNIGYMCISGIKIQCLPYNEETAKLIGTTDDYE